MSSAFWLYSMFQLQLTVAASQEMNSFSGVAPVVLGALAAPEEAAVELLEPPPQAARMPAAPTTPEAFRAGRRLIA